jgi:hypothetical protein
VPEELDTPKRRKQELKEYEDVMMKKEEKRRYVTPNHHTYTYFQNASFHMFHNRLAPVFAYCRFQITTTRH